MPSVANAFGGTFAKPHKPNAQAKFCKRATKPTHQDRHEMTTNNHDRKEGRSANIVYDKNQTKSDKIKLQIYAGSQSLISVG